MFADRLYQLIPASVKNGYMAFQMRLLSPRVRRLFSKFISPGDLVFDVGANVGNLTQIFLNLGARVVCVDPQPYCIEVLKTKFGDNEKVTIIQKGLNHKDGKLPFYISSKDHPTSTFSRQWKSKGRYNSRDWNKTIDAEVTTLDSLINKYGKPAFCKIDVEGFEPQVLQGLNKPLPFLSFEFHQEFLDDARFCAKRLTALGDVHFNYSLHFFYALDSKRWLTYEELFSELESRRNGLMVGDIYARSGN